MDLDKMVFVDQWKVEAGDTLYIAVRNEELRDSDTINVLLKKWPSFQDITPSIGDEMKFRSQSRTQDSRSETLTKNRPSVEWGFSEAGKWKLSFDKPDDIEINLDVRHIKKSDQ